MPMLEQDFDILGGAIAKAMQAGRKANNLTATEQRKASERCEAMVLEIHDTLRSAYPDHFQSSRFLRTCFAEEQA